MPPDTGNWSRRLKLRPRGSKRQRGQYTRQDDTRSVARNIADRDSVAALLSESYFTCFGNFYSSRLINDSVNGDDFDRSRFPTDSGSGIISFCLIYCFLDDAPKTRDATLVVLGVIGSSWGGGALKVRGSISPDPKNPEPNCSHLSPLIDLLLLLSNSSRILPLNDIDTLSGSHPHDPEILANQWAD